MQENHLQSTSMLYAIGIHFFEDASYTSTPTSYNSLSSSTKGCKYTSIAIPGNVGPGITSDRIKDDCFMHSQDGRL